VRCSTRDDVCCRELQCVSVCCNALQCDVVRCSVLQCAEVRCSVLQCVAVRCILIMCFSDTCNGEGMEARKKKKGQKKTFGVQWRFCGSNSPLSVFNSVQV